MINNYGRLNLVLPIVQSPLYMFENKQTIWAFLSPLMGEVQRELLVAALQEHRFPHLEPLIF